MRSVARLLVVCCLIVVPYARIGRAEEAGKAQPSGGSGAVEQRLVETYDSLADSIVALEKAEAKLVHSLLEQYDANAQAHLSAAAQAAAAGQDPAKHLEAAAEEIGKLAVEGGRDVAAITLRLQKAGHHHHTAEGEKFEYVLVGPEMRKRLLDLAKQAGQLGSKATADQIQKLAQDVEFELHLLR
jgi:hypothetical protein